MFMPGIGQSAIDADSARIRNAITCMLRSVSKFGTYGVPREDAGHDKDPLRRVGEMGRNFLKLPVSPVSQVVGRREC